MLFVTIFFILTGSIARSAKRWYLSYAEVRFFAPQRRHIAPMGVKFGARRGPKFPSSAPNFTPIGATVRV